MNPVTVAVVVFLILFGAALLGLRLRRALSTRHLNEETKDAVRLGMGLVATMAALVLGLLVASAKESYDTERKEVIEMAAKIGYLDQVLASYGPEAADSRAALRTAVKRALESMWPEDRKKAVELDPSSSRVDGLHDAVHKLVPKTEMQTSLKAEATGLAGDVSQARWLLFEESDSSVSPPLLVVVISWLAILFLSFGLFAPSNRLFTASMLVAALSVAGAIFLVMELAQPFGGIIQISSGPMRDALKHVGG